VSAVLEIEGLRKTYESWRRGRRVALDGLDMVVERGQVHGFLGPNGSGKTTTLRTLLGLVQPTAGMMRLFGQPVPQRLADVNPRIGAIVWRVRRSSATSPAGGRCGCSPPPAE
jgi:ABC-2 type transport system ATP-binding protein